MKPIEIVDLIKKEDPKVFERVPDKRAARIIRLALAELGKQIESVDEGSFKVPGLGSFRVRQIEQEKDGRKDMIKRIFFRGSKTKAAK
jgi:hypothetical protein